MLPWRLWLRARSSPVQWNPHGVPPAPISRNKSHNDAPHCATIFLNLCLSVREGMFWAFSDQSRVSKEDGIYLNLAIKLWALINFNSTFTIGIIECLEQIKIAFFLKHLIAVKTRLQQYYRETFYLSTLFRPIIVPGPALVSRRGGRFSWDKLLPSPKKKYSLSDQSEKKCIYTLKNRLQSLFS